MDNIVPYREVGNHRNTKKTTEEFVEQAKSVWGDRYDFSQVDYQGANVKVKVICPEHGEFWIKPLDLLHGHGCSCCSGTRRLNNEIFKEKAEEKHGKNRYDYSLVNYINTSSKVPIICHKKDENGNEHGIFYQTPRNHIAGDGCPKCYRSFKKTVEDFEEQAARVHNGFYVYHGDYNGNKKRIRITCPKHGDFYQTPLYHLQGHGCQKCYDERRGEKTRIGKERFIERAREIHGNKYDYSKVDYVNGKTKVCIICPKHGEFWMTPEKHLNGGQGCPRCSESHMERAVALKLDSLNIPYKREQRFKWLRSKNQMPLDFLLLGTNLAIECQGDQHFRSYSYYGGEDELFALQERDKLKNQLCEANGIHVLYYVRSLPKTEKLPFYNQENTFSSIDKLFAKLSEILDRNKINLTETDLKNMISDVIREIII